MMTRLCVAGFTLFVVSAAIPSQLPEMRLTPAEVRANGFGPTGTRYVSP